MIIIVAVACFISLLLYSVVLSWIDGRAYTRAVAVWRSGSAWDRGPWGPELAPRDTLYRPWASLSHSIALQVVPGLVRKVWSTGAMTTGGALLALNFSSSLITIHPSDPILVCTILPLWITHKDWWLAEATDKGNQMWPRYGVNSKHLWAGML